MKYFILILAISFTASQSQAQILDRVLRKTTNKLEDKLADKLAEAIYKSVEDDIDSAFYDQYEQDSIDGKASGSFSEYMTRLSEGVDLPDSYSFDYRMKMEVSEEGEDTHSFEYLFAEGKGYFGLVQSEQKDESIIVYDGENDLMAIFNLKDKEVQGLPSISTFGAAAYDKNNEYAITKFEKTGRTKKILGYTCEAYRIESERLEGISYLAKNFPISWKDSFGEILKQYSPQMALSIQDIDGMVLLSKSTDKKTEKETTSEATSFKAENFTLNTGEYKNTAYQSSKK